MGVVQNASTHTIWETNPNTRYLNFGEMRSLDPMTNIKVVTCYVATTLSVRPHSVLTVLTHVNSSADRVDILPCYCRTNNIFNLNNILFVGEIVSPTRFNDGSGPSTTMLRVSLCFSRIFLHLTHTPPLGVHSIVVGPGLSEPD